VSPLGPLPTTDAVLMPASAHRCRCPVACRGSRSARQVIWVGVGEVGQAGKQQPGVEMGEHHGVAQPGVGEPITVAAWEPGTGAPTKRSAASCSSAPAVEWHLGNVFTKLGITSRKDLR
jgi:hypothetical protein